MSPHLGLPHLSALLFSPLTRTHSGAQLGFPSSAKCRGGGSERERRNERFSVFAFAWDDVQSLPCSAVVSLAHFLWTRNRTKSKGKKKENKQELRGKKKTKKKKS
jgi:hypothetical protein